MFSMAKTFTAAGNGGAYSIKPGQAVTYTVAGTYTGFVTLRISTNGVNTFETLYAGEEDAEYSGTYKNETTGPVWLMFVAYDTDSETVMTGSVVATLTNVASTLQEVRNTDGKLLFSIDDDSINMSAPLETRNSSGDLVLSVNDTAVTLATPLEASNAAGTLVFDIDTDSINLKGPIETRNSAGDVIYTVDDDSINLAVPIVNTYGAGTAATGVTAVEYGDGFMHTTKLTIDTTLGAIAGGAALGLGKLLYTLPAGTQFIVNAYMEVAITQTQDHITADTPDVGLGTALAEGVIATLDGTAAFESLITGQTAADCDGTATQAAALVAEIRGAAADKTVYLNVADTWAASGDEAALLTGTVVLVWFDID